MISNRIKIFLGVGALLSLFALSMVAGPEDAKKSRGVKSGGQGGGATVEPAVVPAYPFNTWLCRPMADGVTVNVLSWSPMAAYLIYGENEKSLNQKTAPQALTAGEPKDFVLSKLKPDTHYYYQLVYRMNAGAEQRALVATFQTQRGAGKAFTFAIQADSHLDVSTDPKLYQQTLSNVAKDRPDFLIDLGDTSMVDKFGSQFKKAEAQYLAQRYYIGNFAHSVPLFMVLGNHDGEVGSRLGGPDSMPIWSVGMRKKFFPNPESDGIYTGNVNPEPNAGLLQDYYAWEWGNAQFIVLDPFWYSREKKGQDQWSATLGEAQYRWLTATLEKSKSKFRFVFIHHLVGGLGHDVRGGARFAPFMEWGGKNADGSDGFAQHRPGWPLPLHALLVKHHVSAIFHGHDHLYAKEDLDGIVYQEVPQPSNPSGGTKSAEDYGYTGVIMGSSGHIRVTVEAEQAKVEYVRSAVPGVTRADAVNENVEHSYVIKPR